MASTFATDVGARRSTGPAIIPIALGVICAGGGGILALTLVSQFSRFGTDSPYVSNLLALKAPVTSDVGEALGPAGGSVDNLIYVLALVWLAVAASLLLVGAGMWFTVARTRYPEATRRVSAFGLWLGLGVSLMALVPVNGAWRDAGVGSADWGDSAIRVLILTVAGVLLLQISAPQWRHAVKDTFRN